MRKIGEWIVGDDRAVCYLSGVVACKRSDGRVWFYSLHGLPDSPDPVIIGTWSDFLACIDGSAERPTAFDMWRAWNGNAPDKWQELLDAARDWQQWYKAAAQHPNTEAQVRQRLDRAIDALDRQEADPKPVSCERCKTLEGLFRQVCDAALALRESIPPV